MAEGPNQARKLPIVLDCGAQRARFGSLAAVGGDLRLAVQAQKAGFPIRKPYFDLR